jgi:signal transduction histidine kinase
MALPVGLADSEGAPADLGRHNARLIRMRWLAGVAVMGATPFSIVLLHVPLPGSLYLLGEAILVYNLGLLWVTEKQGARHQRLLAVAQYAFDWLALAVFVHLTGGIESPAIWFFLFHVLLAPFYLPGRAPFVFAGLVIVAVAGIAGLEAAGWLVHYPILTTLPDNLYRQPLWIATQLVFFTITLVVSLSLMVPVVRELRERQRQVAALFQGIQAVSSSLELPRVLDALTRSVAVALGAKGASIRLLDKAGQQLTMAAAFGLSQAYLDKGPVQVERSPIDQEALAGKPVIIQPSLDSERLQYPAEIEAEGIGSILCVALAGRSGPLGVLRVYGARPRFFTDENVNFAVAIARQGATAIEHAVTYGALRHTDQVKSQFVRTVTHELRSPVAAGQSLLRSVMHAGGLSELQSDVLRRLSDRLDALQLLINDLLDLAAGKVDGLEASLAPVALEAVVLRVVDHLETQAREKKIELKVTPPPCSLTVTANEDGLGRIFVNLIGNAIKYTPAGGQVRVSLEQTDGEATVAVADNGLGIGPADLPHLFEEFYRGANVKEAGIPGTGLGLAIVKDLVERYGGRVSVKSQPGEGSTFSVTLPLADSRQ